MNRGLLITLSIISAITSGVGGFFRDAFGAPSVRGSTPPIKGGGGHHRFRPHAPNDGHWHMKYHRSRR